MCAASPRPSLPRSRAAGAAPPRRSPDRRRQPHFASVDCPDTVPTRRRLSMMRRGKEADIPRRPETPWLAGAAIGIAIATLATGAMMLGAGLAVGQAVIR